MADTGDIEVSTGSVSLFGGPIALSGTSSTAAVDLHVSPLGNSSIDTVVITPYNIHTATVTVTFEVTAMAPPASAGTEEACEVQVRAHERTAPVIFRVQNGYRVRGFASVADVINCVPQVDRYIKGI